MLGKNASFHLFLQLVRDDSKLPGLREGVFVAVVVFRAAVRGRRFAHFKQPYHYLLEIFRDKFKAEIKKFAVGQAARKRQRLHL